MIAPRLSLVDRAVMAAMQSGFQATVLSSSLLWVYEQDSTVGRYITVAGLLETEDPRVYILSTMTLQSGVVGRPSLQRQAPDDPGRRFFASV